MLNQRFKYVLFVFCLVLLFVPQARAEDNEIQVKCFETLKSNLNEIDLFSGDYNEINGLTYETLEPQFSRYYKNESSFGIDLDEPLFDLRLYSFGRQTGYVHPPYSPFPTSTESDKWDEPAKEYVIAEEYIRDTDNNRHFLSCAFMQISAEDLMKVTNENYLYDGEIISVLKTSAELDYKAWYNENVSFDHNDQIFVNWNRLFIYPKETQNDYFDRYTVAETFPSNIVSDFNLLKKVVPWSNDQEYLVNSLNRVYIKNKDGETVTSAALPVLEPVKKEGNNKIFPLFTYYQNIQNTFPVIGGKIALRGIVTFDALKLLVTTKDDEYFTHIWEIVLDGRAITKYALKKDKGENKTISAFYDEYLKKIKNKELKEEIQELINKEVDREAESIQNNSSSSLTKKINQKFLVEKIDLKKLVFQRFFGFFVLGILLLILLGLVVKRLKK